MRMAGLAFVALALLAAGCGGSGTGPGQPPAATGSLSGQVVGQSEPQQVQLLLDGRPLTIRPDAEGRFVIPNLPPGSHTLAVISPDRQQGAWVEGEVRPGEDSDLGPVEPRPGGQITGLVMRLAEDGALSPLAGVEVLADPEVFQIMANPGAQIYPPPPRDPGRVPYRVLTDEQGSYRIPAVRPGPYLVSVTVPGLEPGRAWVLVAVGETAVADFHLAEVIEPGVATVYGTVRGVTPQGREPLAGALVEVHSPLPWLPSEPPAPVRWGDLPAAVREETAAGAAEGAEPGADTWIAPPWYEYQVFRTLTDRQGQYRLNVPSGRLRISVWAEGYEGAAEPLTLQPDEQALRDFLLRPWEAPTPMPPWSEPPSPPATESAG